MVEFISVDDLEGTGRKKGPVAFAREVHKGAMRMKEMDEDVKLSGELASVNLENNQFGGFQIKIRFHENKMDGNFEFRGSEPANMDPDIQAKETASTISEVASEVGQLAQLLKEGFDLNPWSFAELDAASIGGMGQLTDYEFVYESGAMNGPPDEREFSNRIERVAGGGTSRSSGSDMARM